MLGTYDNYGRVFVETTDLAHGHGGPGWDYGSFLWSPTTNAVGSRIYAPMLEMQPGNLVIHLVENEVSGAILERRFAGYSLVKSEVETLEQPPPNPGKWSGREAYYRVPLEDFVELDPPVTAASFLDLFEPELRREIDARPRHFPFAKYRDEIRLREGAYASEATSGLFSLIQRASGFLPQGKPRPSSPAQPNSSREYEEAKRIYGERASFARNPRLAADAKHKYGFDCAVCGFNFRDAYGDLGDGYIECHHIVPLGTRKDAVTTRTSVDDVAVVCSNCHRMIHRRSSALSVETLKEIVLKYRDD